MEQRPNHLSGTITNDGGPDPAFTTKGFGAIGGGKCLKVMKYRRHGYVKINAVSVIFVRFLLHLSMLFCKAHSMIPDSNRLELTSSYGIF